MMNAVAFDAFGGPEVLRMAQIEEPHAGPGEVRVRVRAVGVNALDWKVRNGAAPFPVDLPHVGGLEAAGVVDEVGPDTQGVSIGDEVLGLTQRGMAEKAILTTFARKPAGLSWAQSASLPVAVETATRTLDQLGLALGDTLLINGASGSVGSAAVQLAVAAGATVVGTASERNHEFLISIGCTPVAYGDAMVEQASAVATNGIDAALDCAGHGALAALVGLVGTPDRVITIADGTAAAHGVRFSAGGPTADPGALANVATAVAAGKFVVLVGRTFTLEDAAEAQRLGETGHSSGKLVILVGDEST